MLLSLGRSTVVLIVTATLSGGLLHAAEPNDDFGSATILPPGVLTVADSLEGGDSSPDTFLGFFADDTFPLPPIAVDDDSSLLGNGLADALFGIPVNPNGSIPLAVTGCCDSFAGAHGQSGDYQLFVDVFDAGGAPIDTFNVTSALFPGVVDQYPFSDAAWIGGSFDAYIDNTVGATIGPDPLDFFRFTGLTPGAPFVAEIIEGDFDTMLALFDSGGALLEVDDDGGDGLLSMITGATPANGELVLAVTGFADLNVLGIHPQVGDYVLRVSVIPEPSALACCVVGLAMACRVSRRGVLAA